MTSQVFEPVLTVHDWWDGPRAGVAHFRGQPHLYLSSWDDAADDWSDIYALAALDAGTLALALEDYEIWRRWRIAFDAGTVAASSGPALPQDAARAQELKGLLGPLFGGSAPTIAHAKAEFRRRASIDARTDPYGLEVRWQVVL